MMDYEVLMGLITDELAHYNEIGRRRADAHRRHEGQDVLAHYDNMEQTSLKRLTALYAQRYRRECEQVI